MKGTQKSCGGRRKRVVKRKSVRGGVSYKKQSKKVKRCKKCKKTRKAKYLRKKGGMMSENSPTDLASSIVDANEVDNM